MKDKGLGSNKTKGTICPGTARHGWPRFEVFWKHGLVLDTMCLLETGNLTVESFLCFKTFGSVWHQESS